MLEKLQYHEIDNFNQERMQEMIENILHDNLDYKTRAVRLGRRIIKINYYDPKVAYNLQGDNKILILQDPNKKCHVNFQGKLEPTQISNVWNEIKRKISNSQIITDQEKIILTREEVIYEIIEKIEGRKIKIDTLKVLDYIGEFQQKYQRLPYKNEIDQIVKEYIGSHEVEKKVELKIEKKKKISPIKNKILTRNKSDNTSGNILVIPKPVGRRLCPHCGNVSTYKIHENIDKSYILCAYPRVYGKRYYCDGCRGMWREK
ncbi:MAG: hypothetical protein ACFFBP_12325 [Promethearchaeota archaeon]